MLLPYTATILVHLLSFQHLYHHPWPDAWWDLCEKWKVNLEEPFLLQHDETHLITLAEGPRDNICLLVLLAHMPPVPVFTFKNSHIQGITGMMDTRIREDIKILQYLVDAARPQLWLNRSLPLYIPCCSVNNSDFSLVSHISVSLFYL